MSEKVETLRKEMSQEDNDLKALGISTKIIREERIERFRDKWYSRLKDKYDVEEVSYEQYRFKDEKFGVMDFYPKANKVHIHKENKWKDMGLKWIIKNLNLA